MSNPIYSEVVQKAEELAKMINAHEYTIVYKSLVAKMKEDSKAQATYTKLVKLGKDLADAKDSENGLSEDFIAENESLKQELADSILVREFVEAQKNYFEMMSIVQKAVAVLS